MNDSNNTGLKPAEIKIIQNELIGLNSAILHHLIKVAQKDMDLAKGISGLSKETLSILIELDVTTITKLSSGVMLFSPRFNEELFEESLNDDVAIKRLLQSIDS